MKKVLSIILCICFLSILTGCGDVFDLESVAEDLTNYYIDMEYNEVENILTASQNVDYINNSEDILTTIAFNLYPVAFCEGVENVAVSESSQSRAYPNGIDYGKVVLTNICVEGIDASYSYKGTDCNILVIEIDELSPDQRLNVSMDYELTLPNVNHRYGYGENTINLANFYPVACVYENGDFVMQPYDSNGDPFYSEMSNYYINLKHSSELIVASSGVQEIIEDTDISTTKIDMMVARDIAIVMSKDFEVFKTTTNGVDILLYTFEDENYTENLQAAVDAIDTFSKLFYQYPYSTYSVVKADFYQGGMEFSGLVYVSSEITDSDVFKNVIIHETAHQWWYSLIGNNAYTESWIDESLTEYTTALFYKYNEGYNYTYSQVISDTYTNMTIYINVYSSVFPNLNTSMDRALNEYDFEAEYVYMIYVKGLLMYDSLANIIGENVLIDALKNYAETFAFNNVNSHDLINSIQNSTKIKVDTFFESWIEGSVVLN